MVLLPSVSSATNLWGEQGEREVRLQNFGKNLVIGTVDKRTLPHRPAQSRHHLC